MNILKYSLKPKVNKDYFEYKNIISNEYWKDANNIYNNVSTKDFLDHKWQLINSVTKPQKLFELIKNKVPETFLNDIQDGFNKAPMSLRISPYLLSLINWDDPYNDPIRIQFIPVSSRLLQDHPTLTLDSLHEQSDSPVPGLTHRYIDKVLFLPLNTCPVYCRFCTRSYAVGPDSEQVSKINLRIDQERWDKAFEYIGSHPEIEDVVISGGDSYMLKAEQISYIGNKLLELDNIRRMRFATKGPCVLPMKLLSDQQWVDSFNEIVLEGRKLGKDVVLHTHFNHPNEITYITQQAIQKLFENGIIVRNQTVLQYNVNDNINTMHTLIKRLSYINVHPYYVYMHDLVKGVEDLRTTLKTAINMEKELRGMTAGFNMPNFMIDAPEGGGKRLISSYETYDEEIGISIYKAPAVKKGSLFYYFDPIHLLPSSMNGQLMWNNMTKEELMNFVTRKIKL